MPTRLIRDGFVDSDAVAALGWFAECAYHRLLLVCDDAGRYDGRAKILASRLFPAHESDIRTEDVGVALGQMAEAGLVVCYEYGGKPFIQVARWQQVSPQSLSRYPWVDGSYDICYLPIETPKGSKNYVKTSLADGIGNPSAWDAEPIGMGCGRDAEPIGGASSRAKTETETETDNNTSCAELPPDGANSAPEPVDGNGVFVSIPLIKKDGLYDVTQSQVVEWGEDFPAVDVPAVLRQIRQWNISHPRNRKTRRGVLGHITGWLGREQNKARPGGSGGERIDGAADNRAQFAQLWSAHFGWPLAKVDGARLYLEWSDGCDMAILARTMARIGRGDKPDTRLGAMKREYAADVAANVQREKRGVAAGERPATPEEVEQMKQQYGLKHR